MAAGEISIHTYTHWFIHDDGDVEEDGSKIDIPMGILILIGICVIFSAPFRSNSFIFLYTPAVRVTAA